MCYKDEKQKMNSDKLQRKLDIDNVPVFIRDYLMEDIKNRLSALNYWSALRDFLLWLISEQIIEKNSISNINIDDFNNLHPQYISKYLRSKEEGGMSPTTLETRKNIIRSFLSNIAYYKESTIGNVEEYFKKVKYKGISSNNNLIKKFPTEMQMKNMEEKILKKKDESVKIRNHAVFRVLKGTGIREFELAGLDIADLYLTEDMPYIKVLPKGSYREIEKRIVYITGDARAAIEEWMEYRKGLNNIIDKDKNAVFINKNGKRLNEYDIQNIFKTYGDGMTPHMIRHWYATLMANTGNLAFAQQQLGHTSVNTTVNNYTNGSYGMKEVLKNM